MLFFSRSRILNTLNTLLPTTSSTSILYRKWKQLSRSAAMQNINSWSKAGPTHSTKRSCAELQLSYRWRQIETLHCVQKVCSQKFLYSRLPSSIIWASFRKVMSVVHDLLIFPGPRSRKESRVYLRKPFAVMVFGLSYGDLFQLRGKYVSHI